mgnify:CR=1 FL=1
MSYFNDLEEAEAHLTWLLSDPTNLISTDKEFDEFLSLSDDINDLEAFKRVCDKNELYEWSAKIYYKILKLKKDEIV